ncbi:hypothetical protein TSAR_006820 [Trichomalopsis sarcophagae]|uniref:Uncharacterized protein n=1 Tax=Trichomalopsis sarcophagae TaxID=543379 RepID=A0A232F3F5_9HYME|nr:hypothetical protein TSAR_006820 [Trichomalopsis sarcophagae]
MYRGITKCRHSYDGLHGSQETILTTDILVTEHNENSYLNAHSQGCGTKEIQKHSKYWHKFNLKYVCDVILTDKTTVLKQHTSTEKHKISAGFLDYIKSFLLIDTLLPFFKLLAFDSAILENTELDRKKNYSCHM